MASQKEINRYLEDVSKRLVELSPTDRKEILAELESHLQSLPADQTMAEIEKSFGSPATLSAQYLRDQPGTPKLARNKKVLIAALVGIAFALSTWFIYKNFNAGAPAACNVGSERGLKCESAEECTSREFINGCCVGGQCDINFFKDQEVCRRSNEVGTACATREKCPSREWIDGCCIAGRCEK